MTAATLSALLARHGGPVPRYTSYPTAVQFKTDFVFDAAAECGERGTVSLYLHIPFCRILCSYCGCLTRAVKHDAPITDYLVLLEKEITRTGSALNTRLKAGHIHFGGGSPNILSGAQLEKLLVLLDRYMPFEKGAEIALEADPRLMTEEKAQAYARAGVNRMSFGVQDFQPETQKRINRVQPYEMVARGVRWLKDAGITQINFDLMYGLPLQTVDTVTDNAKKAMTLGADRISVFGYAHVPWMRPHQKILERHALPGPEERFRQEDAVRRALTEGGYVAVGLDHFAKPGDALAAGGELHRNFQGYTTDPHDTLLGFGLSAISRTADAYAQNTVNFNLYKERVEQDASPVEKGYRLTAEDKLRAEVISALMCGLEADTAEIAARHGFPPGVFRRDLDKLTPLADDGLVTVEGACVRVTEAGRPFVRVAAAAFDAYFVPAENRHARAV